MSKAGRLAALMAFAAVSQTAHAQFEVITKPKANIWYHHEYAGFDVYGVLNDDGDRFELSCDVAFTRSGGASAMMTIGGIDPPPRAVIDVDIDDGEYQMGFNNNRVVRTDCKECADEYKKIWGAVRTGRWLTVKLPGGESSSFTLRGASRVVPATPCTPDYDRVAREPEADPRGYPYPPRSRTPD